MTSTEFRKILDSIIDSAWDHDDIRSAKAGFILLDFVEFTEFFGSTTDSKEEHKTVDVFFSFAISTDAANVKSVHN